jgi:hypothetical protein
LAVAVFAAFAVTACGGSETDSTADDTADTIETNVDTSTDDAIDTDTNADAENTDNDADADAETDGSIEPPIGVDDNGDIEFTDDLDDAIDSVGFDQVIEIAAGQLTPEPSVEVNGDNATLTFPEGSVDLDYIIPCTVVGAFTTEDQAVTVVYPDGERLC